MMKYDINKDNITRRIYLLVVGKGNTLTEEERKIIDQIELRITCNLETPNDLDYDEIDKIFCKYF